MKIIRAGFNDTDIFSKEELIFGGCCFFTEDRLSKYFFEIKNREATLFANTDQHINKTINEFLFYSGFINWQLVTPNATPRIPLSVF